MNQLQQCGRYGTVWLLLCSSLANTVRAADPPMTAVAFAPDGKSVVAVSQSGVHVYGWPELGRQRTFKASASNLHAVVFSPDGKRLAVGGGNPSEEGGVEVFSWPEGKPVATFTGHGDSVRSVVWSDDTRLLTASIDREIRLWELPKSPAARSSRPQDPGSITTLKGHSRSVDAICWLHDHGMLVSTGTDRSVRVWDLKSARLIRSLNQHTGPVHALAVRPVSDGLPMVASAAGDRTIRLWQPTIGRMVRYVRLDVEPQDIAWLDGSRIAASCTDGHVRLVDADEVQVIETLPALDGWAYAIAVHPSDGSLLIGGSHGQLRRITPGPVPR